MARYKGTAYVDGKETEVELDDEKFITVEQHRTRTNVTVQQRLARHSAAVRKELLADADFVSEVLKSKNIDPATLKPGEGKTIAETEITRLQEEWRTKELKPLQEKLTDVEKRFGDSNARTLRAELTRSLIDAGVKPTIAPRIAEIEASRFGFDDKSGQFALKNAAGDGFAFSTKATDDKPFKGFEEFATEWAADKNNAEFLGGKGQQGPSLGSGPRNGVPADLKRSAMTVQQKSEFIAEHGYQKFTELPDK